MGVTNITRNLRDSELVLKDGAGSPASLTLALDEGDLRWTETDNTIEIKDRGTLDHHRKGDDESIQISYSAKLTQLIGASASSGNSDQLYEMVNNTGDTYTSTSGIGEQFTLKYEFTITDPNTSDANNEKVTFAEVYKETLEIAEGDESDLITFNGRDFETKPTVARV